MAYQNFVIKIDRRQTRSHDPETDQFAVSSLKIGGDTGVEVNSTNLVTNSNTATLTNKTFDAEGTGNSLSNISNSNIKAAAGIVESKLTLDYSTSGLNTAITNHTGNTSNPHSVTKAQVLTGDLIVNADVDASAAIVESKLSLDYSTSGLNTAITNHTGDTSNPHSVTKAQVLTGDLIVNADVDASAAIVESKLSLDYGTSSLNTAITGHTGNTSNPHSVTKAQVLTGDLIVNADVDASAAIVESKLSLDYGTSALNTAITNHTGSTSNPHSVTKAQVLTGDLIVNADVDASAAIAESKLSLDYSTSSLNDAISALSSGSRFREYTKVLTGDSAPADDTALSTLLPFGDDDAPQLVIGDFSADDFIMFDYDGTPKLLQVYDDAGTLKVTSSGVTQPVEGDCYHIKYNMPAGADALEVRAIYAKSATVMIKIADEVWDTAVGIGLGTWTPGAGVISSSDSVLTALQKLSGNKATLALDNLASTAVNVDIDPGADNSISLGDATHRFLEAHAVTMFSNIYNSEGDNDVAFQRNSSEIMKLLSDRVDFSVPLKTIDNGSGDSDDITIGTGTATGTRGKVILDGSEIDASSTKITNLTDGTALTDAATYGQVKGLEVRALVNDTGAQVAKGYVGFVDADGKVSAAGAGVASIYKKRIVVCADTTIDDQSSGNWLVLPSRSVGAASGESGMTIGEEVYLSSTAGQIEQTITNITAGHAIILLGYAISATDWEFIRPEYLGDA